MHYYTKNIADFNNATRHLTRQERSIYSDLLELQYDIEQPLPDDLDWICKRILARSETERTDVERMLNEYFDHVEQGWSNARCESEIEAYQDKRAKAIAAGKASGEARRRNKKPNKNNNKQDKRTDVEQTLNGTRTDVELTNNHKPITKREGSAKKQRFKKPSLSDVDEFVSDNSLLVDSGAFIDFYESKGWKVGKDTMKDWKAAARNWHRRNQKDTPQEDKPWS